MVNRVSRERKGEKNRLSERKKFLATLPCNTFNEASIAVLPKEAESREAGKQRDKG